MKRGNKHVSISKTAQMRAPFIRNDRDHPTGAAHSPWLGFVLLGSASLLAVLPPGARGTQQWSGVLGTSSDLYIDGRCKLDDRTNWGSGDACSWFGITCDQDATPGDNTSHVVQVYLSYKNLNGSIADLTGVGRSEDIQVDNNLLTGSIPY
jgi:hypothetical protein